MKILCDECGTDITDKMPFRRAGTEVVKQGTAVCESCNDGEAEFRGWCVVGPSDVMDKPAHWVPDVLQ